jgi:TatD DNase family protein
LLVDTHCHLTFDAFAEDLEEVLRRAWGAGVERVLIPGIDAATSRSGVALAEAFSELFAAVGVHPNDSRTWGNETLLALREMALHAKVSAIGEIGLDYYRDRAPKDLQITIFQTQLDLARELDLPVVIHNREATGDLLSILETWVGGMVAESHPLALHPGVLHSFSGTPEEAGRAVDLGFCIGITGPVTFKNSAQMQEVVRAVPLESLLVETDAPFLTPHPHRGKRNEPAFVRFVAQKIAELRDVPLLTVEIVTTSNAERLFNWRVKT